MTVGLGGRLAEATSVMLLLHLGLVLDGPRLHPIGGTGAVLLLAELRLLRNCLP